MNFNVAVIPGDGIGPEIVTEAQKVLDAVGKKFGHTFNYTEVEPMMQYCLAPSVVSSDRTVGTNSLQT